MGQAPEATDPVGGQIRTARRGILHSLWKQDVVK
jgi:hypothetical protein